MIPVRDDNPIRRTPAVTFIVIGLCALAYAWQLTLGDAGVQQSYYQLGLIPAVVTQQAVLPPELVLVPSWLTVFTSMFVHGGFLHLAGNLLYLWIFADNVEDAFGRGRFVVFYLLCGVGAAIAQVLPDPGSRIPMVGASGAISGVLGAYLLMFPRAHVLVALPVGFMLRLVRLRAITVLGLWFLLQLLSSLLASQSGGGVAFRAHIGGFVTGLILQPLFVTSRRDG